MNKPTQKNNIGNAGEYYLAARLSEHNFITTITLGRAERYDILALSPRGRSVKISVKTRQLEKAKTFILSEKDDKNASNDFFYAFVKLNEFKKEPDVWIIPSRVVCAILKKSHNKFRITRNQRGQPHKYSSVRQLPILVTGKQMQRYYPANWAKEMEKYLSNFKLLL